MQNYRNHSFRGPKKKCLFHYIILHSAIGSLESNCNVLFWMFLSHLFWIFFLFDCGPTDPVGSKYTTVSSFCPFKIFSYKVNYETKTMKPWAESLLVSTLAKTPSGETRRSALQSLLWSCLKPGFFRTLYLDC